MMSCLTTPMGLVQGAAMVVGFELWPLVHDIFVNWVGDTILLPVIGDFNYSYMETVKIPQHIKSKMIEADVGFAETEDTVKLVTRLAIDSSVNGQAISISMNMTLNRLTIMWCQKVDRLVF